jgi:hypothetical protein
MSIYQVFPGRVAVTPPEAGAVVFGWKASTSYNHIYMGTFPFPVTEIGGRKVVTLAAIAEALGETQQVDVAIATSNRRKPGRPRKMATRP